MLTGRSAVVTGGSTGIGYAVAAALALLVDAGGATIPVTPTAASAQVT